VDKKGVGKRKKIVRALKKEKSRVKKEKSPGGQVAPFVGEGVCAVRRRGLLGGKVN